MEIGIQIRRYLEGRTSKNGLHVEGEWEGGVMDDPWESGLGNCIDSGNMSEATS